MILFIYSEIEYCPCCGKQLEFIYDIDLDLFLNTINNYYYECPECGYRIFIRDQNE